MASEPIDVESEVSFDEDIIEADDQVNIPMVQTVHRSATQTMNMIKKDHMPS